MSNGMRRLLGALVLLVCADVTTSVAYGQDPDHNHYCYDSQCYPTLPAALAAADADAIGELHAVESWFTPASPYDPSSVPTITTAFEPEQVEPAFLQQTFGVYIFDHGSESEDIFPCSAYQPPFNQGRCLSESEISSGMPQWLPEKYNTDNTFEVIGIEGSWNQLYTVGFQPFLMEGGLEGQRHGVIGYMGKQVRYLETDSDGEIVGEDDQSFLRFDLYQCPSEHIFVDGGTTFTGSLNPADYGWPNMCRDINDYRVVQEIDYDCGACDEGGIDISTGSVSHNEQVLEVDGVDIDLTYSSRRRAWEPTFEKRIHGGYGSPVALELKPGSYAPLTSSGSNTFTVGGRPGELVIKNPNGTYAYRAQGQEYRIDPYEGGYSLRCDRVSAHHRDARRGMGNCPEDSGRSHDQTELRRRD